MASSPTDSLAAPAALGVELPGQRIGWRIVRATPSRRADVQEVWHGLVTDVTAQKEREADAAGVQQRWRTAVDAAQLGLITIDPKASTVSLDARACRHHGLAPSRGELTVAEWLARFAIDAPDRGALIEQIGRSAQGETFSIACPMRHSGAGEPERHVEVIAQAVTMADGCSQLLVGSSRDVTATLHIELATGAALPTAPSRTGKAGSGGSRP